MDTSETYIKICEKAKEIQTRQLIYGDYYTFRKKDFVWKFSINELVGQYLKPKIEVDAVGSDFGKYLIWLPRQDQLQETMSDYIQEQLGIIHSEIKQAFVDFAVWLGKQYLDEPFTCVPTNCFETGEQLWLAFVMQEKYNKLWNGEDWIKGAIHES